MGLFTKRPPCAICGGKVKGLLTWKIEGQMVCDECHGFIDLPKEIADTLTMEEFKVYRVFREENNLLKEKFQTTEAVSLGFIRNNYVFDTTNRLFSKDPNLNGTIFEGSCVKSFTICEDSTPLFEGSADGLKCYTSTVPDRVTAMAPMVQQVRIMLEMQRNADRVAEAAREAGVDNDCNRYTSSHYYENIPEPFEKFTVKIECEHPYWKTLTMEKKGPTFDSSYPRVEDYLQGYRETADLMSRLAHVLKAVAFPDAPEQVIALEAAVVPGQTAGAPASSADVVAEIQRFKELADQGILTEEEFAAKKRQLLGI